MKKLLVTLLAATALAALPGRAHAQARLTFSGGNGTPLTINLLSPISFVITTAPTTISAPIFDLQGVGNLFPGGGSYQAGGDTIAFSVNGGPAMVEGAVTSGQTNGSFAAADFLFLTTDAPLAVGNTVVLSAGRFTTQLDVAGAPPGQRVVPDVHRRWQWPPAQRRQRVGRPRTVHLGTAGHGRARRHRSTSAEDQQASSTIREQRVPTC